MGRFIGNKSRFNSGREPSFLRSASCRPLRLGAGPSFWGPVVTYIKKLAKVASVKLHIEDHGILTISISLDFGGIHQGFGGYSLDTYDKEKKRRVGTDYGTEWILRLLNLFAVTSLDEIKGRSVYALYEKDEWNAFIEGLEMPEFDGGKRFVPKEMRKEYFPDEIEGRQ
jgi:hypothetical protein